MRTVGLYTALYLALVVVVIDVDGWMMDGRLSMVFKTLCGQVAAYDLGPLHV